MNKKLFEAIKADGKTSNKDHNDVPEISLIGLIATSSSIQKVRRAARRATMVNRVRSMHCAERFRVRFIADRVIGLPKSVHLYNLKSSVAQHMTFATDSDQRNFHDLFTESPQIDMLIKDMFWQIVCSYFQTGTQKEIEMKLYDRVAENYTALFLSLETKKQKRMLKYLPDSFAQVLFHAIHDAFPKSRRDMLDTFKKWIIELTYSWFTGFAPAVISWTDWLPQTTIKTPTRKVVSMTDFPATKNRLLRMERLERMRTHEAMKHRGKLRTSAEEESDEEEDEKVEEVRSPLPDLPTVMSTHESIVYTMKHSPLIEKFLSNHQIHHPEKLQVKCRLTTDHAFQLKRHAALEKNEASPIHRRHRILDSTSYSVLLQQFEQYNKTISKTHREALRRSTGEDRKSVHRLQTSTQSIEEKRKIMMSSEVSIHELSNVLVCKRRTQEEQRLQLNNRVSGAPISIIPQPPSSTSTRRRRRV